MAALVAVAQREPSFFTEHSKTAFKDKDTTSYPDCASGEGDAFRYPSVLQRYKVRPRSTCPARDRFSPHSRSGTAIEIENGHLASLYYTMLLDL